MNQKKLFDLILSDLDLPPLAYEKAEARYQDMGEFFGRDESTLLQYTPCFRPQGSFRIGTAIKPIKKSDPHDLDITCLLESGWNENNISQSDFKDLINAELESFKNARGIKKDIESKRRCLRLNYSGDVDFHIDVVPSIPVDSDLSESVKRTLMIESKLEENLADKAAQFTMGITDEGETLEEKEAFNKVPSNWKLSSPEGYALWFIKQMSKNQMLEESLTNTRDMKIEDIPTFQWNSPLQQAIKIFKRHRDLMYIDTSGDEKVSSQSDSKPISIIITTLAAHVYEGESSLDELLTSLPEKMKAYLVSHDYELPNPVRPGEYFTDKWGTAKGLELKLKEHFIKWLDNLASDLNQLVNADKTLDLKLLLEGRFGVRKSEHDLSSLFGSTLSVTTPATAISIPTDSPKPWYPD